MIYPLHKLLQCCEKKNKYEINYSLHTVLSIVILPYMFMGNVVMYVTYK